MSRALPITASAIVEVTGYPGQAKLSSLEGRVVHDDLESAGDFACSNPLLNRSTGTSCGVCSGNYRSIPTDCPQRDERQGWLGDRSAESKGETYLFNTAALYAKWLQDMADAQKANGSVSDVCPAYWPIYFRQRHLAEQHGHYPRRACATSSPISAIIATPLRQREEVDGLYEWFLTDGIIAARFLRRLVRAARGAEADPFQ